MAILVLRPADPSDPSDPSSSDAADLEDEKAKNIDRLVEFAASISGVCPVVYVDLDEFRRVCSAAWDLEPPPSFGCPLSSASVADMVAIGHPSRFTSPAVVVTLTVACDARWVTVQEGARSSPEVDMKTVLAVLNDIVRLKFCVCVEAVLIVPSTSPTTPASFDQCSLERKECGRATVRALDAMISARTAGSMRDYGELLVAEARGYVIGASEVCPRLDFAARPHTLGLAGALVAACKRGYVTRAAALKMLETYGSAATVRIKQRLAIAYSAEDDGFVIMRPPTF